jgi:hypothetical protein
MSDRLVEGHDRSPIMGSATEVRRPLFPGCRGRSPYSDLSADMLIPPCGVFFVGLLQDEESTAVNRLSSPREAVGRVAGGCGSCFGTPRESSERCQSASHPRVLKCPYAYIADALSEHRDLPEVSS